jgi:hypothetical protein
MPTAGLVWNSCIAVPVRGRKNRDDRGSRRSHGRMRQAGCQGPVSVDHRRLLMADCVIHWVIADWVIEAFLG